MRWYLRNPLWATAAAALTVVLLALLVVIVTLGWQAFGPQILSGAAELDRAITSWIAWVNDHILSMPDWLDDYLALDPRPLPDAA